MKNSSAKTKCENMRTFHVQLLFQAVTESYSNHCAAAIIALTVVYSSNFDVL